METLRKKDMRFEQALKPQTCNGMGWVPLWEEKSEKRRFFSGQLPLNRYYNSF
jgi:hypothetical protein